MKHQKGFTNLEGVLISLAVVFGLAVGIYVLVIKRGDVINISTPSIAPLASHIVDEATNPDASLKEYTSIQYGFTLKYPANFAVSTPEFGFLKTLIVKFTAQADKYPKTNLIDYSLSVNTDSNISDCFKGVDGNSPNSGRTLTEKVDVNGQTFYKDRTMDAAAGNLYESRIYRTIHGTSCFEVLETIHTGNIGNYPQEAGIREVNKDPVWAELEKIFSTFNFVK